MNILDGFFKPLLATTTGYFPIRNSFFDCNNGTASMMILSNKKTKMDFYLLIENSVDDTEFPVYRIDNARIITFWMRHEFELISLELEKLENNTPICRSSVIQAQQNTMKNGILNVTDETPAQLSKRILGYTTFVRKPICFLSRIVLHYQVIAQVSTFQPSNNVGRR